MRKTYYVLAIVSFLSIPVVIALTMAVFSFINPEIAAGHAGYVRIYRLLALAKTVCLWGGELAILGLWFLTCLFVLKSKQQSYAWLFFALLGPPGFAVLSALGDKAPAPGDFYQKFAGGLKLYLRVPLELGFFVLVWSAAYQLVFWKSDFMIAREAAATGQSIAQIIDVRNASGGMWAFGEGMEAMYLVVLIYLLWPVCFNAARRAGEIIWSARPRDHRA
jgi:hypothetical protein